MPDTDAPFNQSFVQSLNRVERQVLVLYYAEELSPAEIGLVLELAQTRVLAVLDDLHVRARTVLAACAIGPA